MKNFCWIKAECDSATAVACKTENDWANVVPIYSTIDRDYLQLGGGDCCKIHLLCVTTKVLPLSQQIQFDVWHIETKNGNWVNLWTFVCLSCMRFKFASSLKYCAY